MHDHWRPDGVHRDDHPQRDTWLFVHVDEQPGRRRAEPRLHHHGLVVIRFAIDIARKGADQDGPPFLRFRSRTI